ncbi:MAG: hypothetical protein ACKOJF_30155, partial [Planctomycetaceae bacterium]
STSARPWARRERLTTPLEPRPPNPRRRFIQSVNRMLAPPLNDVLAPTLLRKRNSQVRAH